MSKTRMTVGQAIVKFLNQQYIEMDGKEEPLRRRHVHDLRSRHGSRSRTGVGRGSGSPESLPGPQRAGMAHAAISYAKQHNRRKIIACTSSIGVGAANMVTAALTATINNIPLLLFPSDYFATRQPDPVLQQLEVPDDLSMSASDCFKPVAQVLGSHFPSGAADERDGQCNARPDRHRKLRHGSYLAAAGCAG